MILILIAGFVILVAVMTFVFGVPGFAEDAVNFDIAPSEDCFFSAEATMPARQVCFGLASKKCIKDNELTDDPAGSAACYSEELSYWGIRLDQNYALIAEFAEGAEATAMNELREGWGAYRDATCSYEQILNGEAEVSGPVWTECAMKMTAEHSLYLELKTYD